MFKEVYDEVNINTIKNNKKQKSRSKPEEPQKGGSREIGVGGAVIIKDMEFSNSKFDPDIQDWASDEELDSDDDTAEGSKENSMKTTPRKGDGSGRGRGRGRRRGGSRLDLGIDSSSVHVMNQGQYSRGQRVTNQGNSTSFMNKFA